MQVRPSAVASQHVVKARNVLSSESCSEVAANVNTSSLFRRQSMNGAYVPSASHSPQLAIMQHNGDAICRQLHVKFDCCETIIDGEIKRCEGVLGRL